MSEKTKGEDSRRAAGDQKLTQHQDRMELTTLCWIFLLFRSGITAGRTHLALLSVIPNRSQFFKYEAFSLSCVVQGSSVGWQMKRNTITGNTSCCGSGWGSQNGSLCLLSAEPSDSGLYWCESIKYREHSNAVNITVHAGPVILESPVLPVSRGDSVTLRCKNETTPSNLNADFYQDSTLIRSVPTGEMTIPAVSLSDQGWYWCQSSKIGRSPKSWITVTDRTGIAWNGAMSLPKLLCFLLAVTSFLLVTMEMLVEWHWRWSLARGMESNKF